ncbi:MAG: ketoacyl-ACP synthase III [Proteobacteria bacterium]|nr:MAG: ketoacyl-ACP synthase III [Pseudomonadota bacterium]
MYVPPRVVTNKDLEKIMDTTDEWIRQRSGIESRHHVDGQGTADLAYEATLKALAAAKCEAKDIELIILATLSPDHMFPGSSAILQHRLGLETTPSMDLRAQCSGFLYSMNVAKAFIESGTYKRILVVGSETHSPVIDITTRGRDVAVLFGDGSGAVIVEAAPADDTASYVGDIILHSQGQYADRLWIERPGTRGGTWLTDEHLEAGKQYPYMEGRYVYKHAVERLQEVIKEILEKEKLTLDQIDHFIFHQANIRINEKVAELMKIPAEKCPSNIQKYGNCSAASIPMLLDETVKSGRIKRGDTLLMAAFGAGFTWAAGVIRY